MEGLAEFEVLEGVAAGDRLTATPVGVAGVESAGDIRSDLGGGFAPVLGDFAAAVIPKVGSAEGLDARGIGFVVGDGDEDVAIGGAGKSLERVDGVGGEVDVPVIRIELKGGDGAIGEVYNPGAGLVAHGGGEDAGFNFGGALLGMDREAEFVGGVGALGEGEANVRAVVEALNKDGDGEFLDAICMRDDFAGIEVRRVRGGFIESASPEELARFAVKGASFEFAEAFAPGDNRLDSDEVDEVIGGVRESGIADADKAARAAVTTGEAGGVQGELESAPDAPKGSVGVQPGANPRVICG